MNETANRYSRTIARSWTAQINRLGPTHRNSYILEPGRFADFDPFLFLAEDWFGRGSFDVHPHRGIETVTYVMSGKLEHYDNKTGVQDEIGPGDAQWMTAGSGVIHKEDPAPGETVHSLQLWVNLPATDKMTRPRYQYLRSADMPVRTEEGIVIRVFSGASGNVQATTQNYVPVTMLEIQAEPGATLRQEIPGDYNGFLFVLEGEGTFGSEEVMGEPRSVHMLGPGDPKRENEVRITAVTRLRVLLYAGRPLHEPVVARGPFVMNTAEQIQQAFQDYTNGKFGE